MKKYIKRLFYTILPIEVSTSEFANKKETVLSSASPEDIRMGFKRNCGQLTEQNSKKNEINIKYSNIFK